MNTKYKAQIDSVLHYVNQQIGNDWSASASHAFNKATQADVLARIACMSVRNFQLYFNGKGGGTMAQFIEAIKGWVKRKGIRAGTYSM